jgi:hypothetical protein
MLSQLKGTTILQYANPTTVEEAENGVYELAKPKSTNK